MRAKVDISEVTALTREALASLGRAPTEMLGILREKAAEERDTHAYQNRTGNLEASTFASEIYREGDDERVEFGARTFYAGFVNKRGLMQVDELEQQAETEIDFLLDSEAERLGGM
jgi:hypothetical protein